MYRLIGRIESLLYVLKMSFVRPLPWPAKMVGYNSNADFVKQQTKKMDPVKNSNSASYVP